MRWRVTLSASKRDIEFLTSESLRDVSVAPENPRQLILELQDPKDDVVGIQTADVAKVVIDGTIRRINGFGKLRWGRTFEGVELAGVKSFDAAGHATQYGFLGTAVDHMLPENYADLVERLGHPRPPRPEGLDVVNALGYEAVAALAAENPDVARVLRLIELMLEGDDEIDWVAAYSTLEVIKHDLAKRNVDGHAQGWWTTREWKNFTATANSPEVLGFHARHGKPSGLKEARMTAKQASWLVRRVAAHWLTHLQLH